MKAGAPTAPVAAVYEAIQAGARHMDALRRACVALTDFAYGSDEIKAALVQVGAPAALVAGAPVHQVMGKPPSSFLFLRGEVDGPGHLGFGLHDVSLSIMPG